jgi:hypothetical protein
MRQVQGQHRVIDSATRGCSVRQQRTNREGIVVEANQDVVKALNGLLTIELRAINQYFLDSKMASH